MDTVRKANGSNTSPCDNDGNFCRMTVPPSRFSTTKNFPSGPHRPPRKIFVRVLMYSGRLRTVSSTIRRACKLLNQLCARPRLAYDTTRDRKPDPFRQTTCPNGKQLAGGLGNCAKGSGEHESFRRGTEGNRPKYRVDRFSKFKRNQKEPRISQKNSASATVNLTECSRGRGRATLWLERR